MNKIKCPFCIGQNNNDRMTLYLYPNGRYWCARCKATGSITELENVDFKLIPKQLTQVSKLEYNNQGLRFSTCKERNYANGVDTFQIKDVTGNLVGHYNRYPEKRSKTVGQRLFSYKDAFLVPGRTYRLVEGVYDCIYPEDVALHGIPSTEQAKRLKHYNLILCPDSDVWKKEELFISWFTPFLHSTVNVVEYIEHGDPDEVVKGDRRLVDWKKVKGKLWELKNLIGK